MTLPYSVQYLCSMNAVLDLCIVFQMVVGDEGKDGGIDAGFEMVVGVLGVLGCDLKKERVDVEGITAGIIRDPFQLLKDAQETMTLQTTVHFQVFCQHHISQLKQHVAVHFVLAEDLRLL